MDVELAGAPHRSWEAGVDPKHLAARDALFDAVAQEVAMLGWSRANVAGICRRAGVSVAAFDALFADKQSCFVAAGRAFAGDLFALVERASHGTGDWESGVRAGLGAFLEYIAEHPAAARAFLVEGLSAGPEALAVRDVALRTFADLLCGAECVRAVGASPALASEASVGGVYDIVTRRVRDGQVAALPDLLSALAHFLLAPRVCR